jgi:hypothetical protein
MESAKNPDVADLSLTVKTTHENSHKALALYSHRKWKRDIANQALGRK